MKILFCRSETARGVITHEKGITTGLGTEDILPAKVQPAIKFSLNTYYVPHSNIISDKSA